MSNRAGRIRLAEKMNRPHPAPVVRWQCKKGHTLLRVFKFRDEYLVLGESFLIPLADWIERAHGDVPARDVKSGRVAAMEPKEVAGMNETLQLDIDEWPAGVSAEVGCQCAAASVRVPIGDLAADVQHVKTGSKLPVRRIVDVV